MRLGDQGTTGAPSPALEGALVGVGFDSALINHPHGFSTLYPGPNGWKIRGRSKGVTELLLLCTYKPPHALRTRAEVANNDRRLSELTADSGREEEELIAEYGALLRSVLHGLIDAIVSPGATHDALLSAIDAYPTREFFDTAHPRYRSIKLVLDRLCTYMTRERLHNASLLLHGQEVSSRFTPTLASRLQMHRPLASANLSKVRAANLDELLDLLSSEKSPLRHILSQRCELCEKMGMDRKDERIGELGLFEALRESALLTLLCEAQALAQGEPEELLAA